MQIDPTGTFTWRNPTDGNRTYRINVTFKKAAEAVGGHYTSLQAPPESLSASLNNDNNANAMVCVTACESPNQYTDTDNLTLLHLKGLVINKWEHFKTR